MLPDTASFVDWSVTDRSCRTTDVRPLGIAEGLSRSGVACRAGLRRTKNLITVPQSGGLKSRNLLIKVVRPPLMRVTETFIPSRYHQRQRMFDQLVRSSRDDWAEPGAYEI